MGIFRQKSSKHGIWARLVSTNLSVRLVQAVLTVLVPAFVLGIVFGPAASDFMNVSDWDLDGVYHTTHEVAYVRQHTRT